MGLTLASGHQGAHEVHNAVLERTCATGATDAVKILRPPGIKYSEVFKSSHLFSLGNESAHT